MKRLSLLTVFCALALLLSDSLANAQPPGGRPGQGSGRQGGGPGGPGGGRGQGMGGSGAQQMPPLLRIFDADGDGELSSKEIDAAASALRKLDQNRDGRLTAEEFRPTGQPDSQGEGRGGPRGAMQGGQPGGGRPGGGPVGGGAPGGGRPGGDAAGGGRGGDPAQADAAFAKDIMSFDENKDGMLGKSELPEHMHQAFDIADADKNGSLNEKELLVLASQFRRGSLSPDAEQEIKNAPTQGRGAAQGGGAGQGQGRGGRGQSGGRDGQGMGSGQRGGGGQASRGGERERPRDRVSPRDAQFNEMHPLGATLPDSLQLYNVDRKLVAANSIFDAKYTVIVGGCLTCPEFRNSYPEIEAVAADFRDKGVQFYFLFQSLTHPENWGYVQPTSIQERFAQVDHAKDLLKTSIPWLTDTMENEMKQHFGMTPNSQFAFDRDGKIVHRASWGRGSSLRESLEELVGPSEKITTVAELNLPQSGSHRTNPNDMLVERKTLEGIAVPLKVAAGGQEMQAESLTSLNFTESNRYAKLRPEADQELLRTGSGQLYLGFRQDPILGAEWNNLATPPKYRITADGVTVTPAMAEAEKLSVESDTEPREFLVDVKNWESGKPIKVEIQYFACNKKKGWCKPVTQEFTVWLQQDRTAGMVAGRSHFPGGRGNASQGGQGRPGAGQRPGRN
ncbi:EF hand [Rubripirellula tenax]|uniref:EF hand n=1 Tax=Rubripirellula tenax TaxID=2528015 RepID=A0A5C6FGP8_9BACT|nr:hypothetical protein [Rubripirellula tenax]TWU59266.1 EF hand [Rubripirellula tenax]